MPNLASKTIANGVLELNIEISPDEIKPHLEQAAVSVQADSPIAGFRPGKAPYAEVQRTVGPMKLLEKAVQRAVPSAYVEIIQKEKLQTIGDPDIQVTKIAPEQTIEFSVKIALLPEVNLGDYKSVKVNSEKVEVDEKELDDVINELRDMRATQAQVDRSATKDDRVMVDMNISKDKVPLEGGQTKDHAIDLFRPYIIEGFTEKLIGAKAGDKKEFELPFPADHYDKKLAGQTVHYEVTVKQVMEFKRPELNDEFVKSVGPFENVAKLKEQLKQNLLEMKQSREDQRLERQIIDEVIKQTKFGDIPEILIEAELRKILYRVMDQVQREGGNWEEYLQHLGKNVEELKQSWIPEAKTRVEAALLVRAIADAEKIEADEKEIESERQAILSHYQEPDQAEIREEVNSKEYDSHLKHLIETRKVMQLLKNNATKK
jgi:trigger factor